MIYFNIDEFIKSDVAAKNKIDNTPSSLIKGRIVEMVDNLLDPLRIAWADYCKEKHYGGGSLIVTSGYRCPALNKKVGGSTTSAHMIGYAADLQAGNGKTKELIKFAASWLKDKNIKFDQCIDEKNGKWLHLGYKNNSNMQRQQIFKK